jgi:hypothetical protein
LRLERKPLHCGKEDYYAATQYIYDIHCMIYTKSQVTRKSLVRAHYAFVCCANSKLFIANDVLFYQRSQPTKQ